jgi:beta-glucosidase
MQAHRDRSWRRTHRFAASVAVCGLLFGGLQAALAPAAAADTLLPYQDKSLSASVRAADLVSRMTLAEKSQQLNAQTQTSSSGIAPAIPRLGVKAYGYWNEALHGVARSGAANLNQGGTATDFPTGIALASSWNRELVRKAADTVSTEARAFTNFTNPSYTVANKGLTYWSPTINMLRDPRWGRGEETYGEDPYLTGQIGGQFTDGMQGDPSKNGGYLKTIVTPKHYLANNSETNRHIGSAEITEAEEREYYTPAFSTLIHDHNAKSIMTSYNRVNGVPVSVSRYYLETLVKRTWGFTGVVTSDCDAIRDAWHDQMHGYGDQENVWVPAGITLNQRTGIAFTLKAGTDLDCMDGDYGNSSNGLVASRGDGNLTEADIDVALVRAFTIRFEFGEFDDFYASTPWAGLNLSESVDTPQHRLTAAQAAAEGTVLLKNNGILPLAKPTNSSKYVIVGPMSRIVVHGDYSPTKSFEQTLNVTTAMTQYIKSKAPNAQVEYVPVLSDNATDWTRKKGSLGASGKVVRFLDATGTELGAVTTQQIIRSGKIDGWKGIQPWSTSSNSLSSLGAWGGYFGIDADIPAGTTQIAVAQSTPVLNGSQYLNESGNQCYKPGNTFLPGRFSVSLGDRFNGQVIGTVDAGEDLCGTTPTATTSEVQNKLRTVSTKVANRVTQLAGTKQKLYFEWSSSFFDTDVAKLAATDTNSDGVSDADAIANADVVVAYVGTLAMQSVCLTNPNETTENCSAGGLTAASDSSEDEDRVNLDLSRGQDKMIQLVAGLNPNTVAWMQTVATMNVEPFKDKVAGLVWTSYNGQAQSRNVADTLFGEVNPSGRLPYSNYSDITQLPDTKDYQMTPDETHAGRTYQYFTKDVTYPFGYGLTYSKFEYSNLRLASAKVDVNGEIKATVTVKNTSARDGQEVVQLYVSSPKASDPLRPNIQLKGFEKVAVRAGQSKDVTITVKAADLWFWNSGADRKTFDLGTWKLHVGPSSDISSALKTTFTLSGYLAKGIDVVAAVPDGLILNTEAPKNVIHANLSASRTDQSFYDLSKVEVAYTSSDPAVAAVDANGSVRPVAQGLATITATVTADGTTKSTSFPVVVRTGTLAADANTLYGTILQTPDQSISVAQATEGFQLAANVIPVEAADSLTYRVALGEENSAEATISATGLLTASKPGLVRYTVVAKSGATVVGVRSASVVIGEATVPSVDRADLANAVQAVEALMDDTDTSAYTASSVAAVSSAINAAKAVLADQDATQENTDEAFAALFAAYGNLTPLGDVDVLAGPIAAVAELAPLQASFTSSSWAAVTAALNAAVKVKSSPNTDLSVDDIHELAVAISDAIAALTVVDPDTAAAEAAARAELNSLVTAAYGYIKANYTAASWSQLQSALTTASAAVSPSQVTAASAALKAALAGLQPVPPEVDQSAIIKSIAELSNLYTTYSKLSSKSYTAASWATMASALAKAQSVLANTSATLTQLREAVVGLTSAQASLQKPLKASTPKVTGTAKVGKTLKIKKGSWTSGTKFSYQWYAGGKTISGATKSTLKLTKAHKGKTIKVKVTGAKAGYSTVAKTSKSTKAVKK